MYIQISISPPEWEDLPLIDRLEKLATWSFEQYGDQGYIDEFMEAKARIEVLEAEVEQDDNDYHELEQEFIARERELETFIQQIIDQDERD